MSAEPVAEYEFPLSYQQTRLWLVDKLDPANPAYNVPITLRLRGRLRVGALAGALQVVVDRHEALRTRFEPDEQLQVVLDEWSVRPVVVDLSGMDVRVQSRLLGEIKRATARRPFDLWSAPPLRVGIVRLSPLDHLLIVVLHHIVCDGWSVRVLAAELSAAYAAHVSGLAPDLPELSVQYGDFALWQREWLDGERLGAELAHWAGELAGAPAVIDLPTDRPRPPRPTHTGARARAELDNTTADRLEQLAREHGVSLFMVLLAGFAAVLSTVSGQDEVVIGTATSGRTRPELGGLVGCFFDVAPLRVDLSGDPSVAEVLATARRVCTSAFAHQDVPFEKLVERLRPPRDLARTPVFQVMLNHHEPAPALTWPDLEVTGEESDAGVAKYDLTVDSHRGSGGLVLDLEYNSDVFEPASAGALLDRLAQVLRRFTELTPTEPVAEAVAVTADELDRLRDLMVHPTSRTSADLSDMDSPLLAERASRFAAHLMAHGVRPGDAVGLLVPAAVLPEALTGLWRLRAAAVPLDPGESGRHNRFALTDAGVRAVVTTAGSADRLPALGIPVVLVPETAGTLPRPASPPGLPTSDGAALACVRYRASAGRRPVATATTQAEIAASASALAAEWAPDPGTTVLVVPECAGEPAPAMLVAAAMAGADVLVSEPDGAADALAGPNVSVAVLAASRWRALLDAGRVPARPVRAVCVGREAGAVVNELRAAGHSASTVYEWAGPVGTALVGDARGWWPVEGSEAAVLDRAGRPAGIGVVGELCVAAPGREPGGEVVDSPFTTGRRLRRTGQLAWLAADGRLRLREPDAEPRVESAAPPVYRSVAPRTDAEAEVLGRMRAALGDDRIGVTDNFFDHGGSSVTATALLVDLERITGTRLSLRSLFELGTAEAIAAMMPATDGAGNGQTSTYHRLPADLEIGEPVTGLAEHVLLTGMPTVLGAALVDRVLSGPGTTVTCLVPAGDDRAALNLLRERLAGYGVDADRADRLHAVAADLGVDRFALPERRYLELAAGVTVVYHDLTTADRPQRETWHTIQFAAASAGKTLFRLEPIRPGEPEALCGHTGSGAEEPGTGAGLVYQAACRGLAVTVIRVDPASTGDHPDPLTAYVTAVVRTGTVPDTPLAAPAVVPAPDLADTILTVRGHPAADGQVVHLVAPPPPAPGELVEMFGALGHPVRLVEPGEWLTAARHVLDDQQHARLLVDVPRPVASTDRAAALLGGQPRFTGWNNSHLNRVIGQLPVGATSRGA